MVDMLKRGIYLIGDYNEAGELKHKLAVVSCLFFFVSIFLSLISIEDVSRV
jgi:hypothetical protein